MSDLTINKLNESYLRLSCDVDLLRTIGEHFTFEVPGYKHTPAYKMGKWDGKIRLLNVGKRTLYVGLYPRLIEYLERNKVEYAVSTDIVQSTDITRETVLEFISSLDIQTQNGPIQIREYQVEGVYLALKHKRGILKAATGAGKSLIMYCIMRYLNDVLGLRMLIVVPTVSLTTQLLSDFKDYSTANKYDMDSVCHLISAGIVKDTPKNLVISTFQSISKQSSEWINSFDCIFTDEGHKVTAASITGLYEQGVTISYRLACTGTLHDTKCNVLVMEGLTGSVYEVATTKNLIDANQLVQLKITCVLLTYSDVIRKAFKKSTYEEEIKYIVNLPNRNRFISKLGTMTKGTTLILFRYIDQGQAILRLCQGMNTSNRNIFYIDGSIKANAREDIRTLANAEDSIIIASYGVFSTGINLPAIENIILASPLKSRITNLQSIGRGLRLKEGKTQCSLYDIGDDLSYKRRVNFAMDHFRERLIMYNQEGFTFK